MSDHGRSVFAGAMGQKKIRRASGAAPSSRLNEEATTRAAAKDRPASKPKAERAGAKQPATRDPQRSSAAILAAAVKEFSEKGFGAARINTIAARANINKRMLYHYFGGKDALYLAVLEGAYVAIRSAETRLHLADRDPVEGMRELIQFTWRYFLDHPEFLSLLATENLHRARYLKRSARIFDLHSPLIAQISTLLRRGAASGQFRHGADPVKTYISIAALGFFYLSNRWTLSTIFRRDLTAEGELDAWGAQIEDVVLSYLRA